jgi:hypothetical protein
MDLPPPPPQGPPPQRRSPPPPPLTITPSIDQLYGDMEQKYWAVLLDNNDRTLPALIASINAYMHARDAYVRSLHSSSPEERLPPRIPVDIIYFIQKNRLPIDIPLNVVLPVLLELFWKYYANMIEKYNVVDSFKTPENMDELVELLHNEAKVI